MKKVMLLFLLLLIPLASANTNISQAQISVEVSGDIQVIPDTGYEFNHIQANIGFYPKEYTYQELISQQVTTNPQATSTDNMEIKWEDQANTYTYNIQSIVETQTHLNKIYKKQNFPITNTDQTEYTLATEFIDINDAIEEQAQQLSAGETDLYKVAFKLAEWTEENIQYNLSTIAADTVEPSSWVLTNRKGVCDELTNLYISFCRSLGIPARFISGIAYTNILNDFGPHGWAEVYIDGQWIPMDIAYGQFGWVDATHIKFNELTDPSQASASFEWSGYNFAIEPSGLNVEAELTSIEYDQEQYLDIQVIPIRTEVGPDSYLPIEVQLTNNNDYYVPTKVYITIAPDLTEDNSKNILLEPGQIASLFWTIRLPSELDPNLIYTTKVQAQTTYGATAESDISYAEHYTVITEQEAEQILSELDIQEDTDYLSTTTINCETDKEVYYNDETAIITCEVQGDTDIELCFKGECQTETMFNVDLAEQTSQRTVITAQKDGKSTYSYFDLTVIETPSFQIYNITPTTMSFKEIKEITFDYSATGDIQDITMNIEGFGTVELTPPTELKLDMLAKYYYNKPIAVVVIYKDSLGKDYYYNVNIDVTVTDVPFIYKVLALIQNLFWEMDYCRGVKYALRNK